MISSGVKNEPVVFAAQYSGRVRQILWSDGVGVLSELELDDAALLARVSHLVMALLSVGGLPVGDA